jgi:hypothetical protein
LIFNLMRESNRSYKTHHTIVQNLSTAPSAVALVDIHDFTKHCERTLEGRVRNWLVAGHDWQICLHKRNLGLNNLRDLVNHGYNFYVTKWSVLKEDGTSLNELDLRDDGLSWQTIPGFGWRLLAD